MRQSTKEAWQRRLRDPVWQFGSVVVAILALVVGISVSYDIYQRSQLGAGLSIAIESKYPDVWFSSELAKELQVYYRGEKASSVSSMFFSLKNTGRSPILPEHFVQPLGISILSSGEVVDVSIVGRHPEAVDVNITSIISNTFQLSKSLWNPEDTVDFRVTIVNEADPWSEPQITYVGRIAGVSNIPVVTNEQASALQFTRAGFSFVFAELCIEALVTLLVFGMTVAALRRRRPDIWSSNRPVMHILILAAGSAVTVFWTGHMVYQLLILQKGEGWLTVWWTFVVAGAVISILYLAYILVVFRRTQAPR